MVNGNRSRLTGQGPGGAVIEIGGCRIYAAAEITLTVVMIPYEPLVRAGQGEHRAVIVGDIIEHDADRQHVVIAVRIEGPVLMPFHGPAAAEWLEIDLGVREADSRADQGFDGVQYGVGPHDGIIGRMIGGRIFDPDQAGRISAVSGVEDEDIVACRDAARSLDEFIGYPAQLGNGRIIEQALDQKVAVQVVTFDLFRT